MSEQAAQIEAGLARAAALPPEQALRMTERAIRHVRSELSKSEDALGLRLGTRKSGCSGWAYLIDLATEPRPDDLVFTFEDDVRVFVDADAMDVLSGTEVDFVTEGLSRMLKFNNPNVTDTCGCGESFAVG
ncbi:MAG: HesB/IscA family protein [Halothiobacillaceae bacterium]